MKILINGEVFTLDLSQCQQSTAPTLAELLQQYQAKPPYAIAINGEFVPQENYLNHTLSVRDKVDVVSPIFGG